ncbi:hypothetical protein ACLB1O_27530 [Escherichia coli]
MPLPDVVFFYVNTLDTVYTCPLNSLALFILIVAVSVLQRMDDVHQSPAELLLKHLPPLEGRESYLSRMEQGGRQFFLMIFWLFLLDKQHITTFYELISCSS